MTTTTVEQTLAEEAMAEAIEEAERGTPDSPHVETFRHADGSATVIVYDPEPINPRTDYDHAGVLVNLSRDFRDLDDDVEGIGEVRDRYDDRATDDETEALVRRFLSIYRPDVLAYVHDWQVSNYGEHQRGFAYITRAGMLAMGFGEDDLTPERAAEVLAAELDEYGRYFAGEVYGAIHLSLGAPQVTYGAEGAYVSGYDVDEDACWGFLGYDNLADICGQLTDSEVVR